MIHLRPRRDLLLNAKVGNTKGGFRFPPFTPLKRHRGSAPGPRLTMCVFILFNFQFNIPPRHNPCRYQKYEEKAGSREQVRGHSAQVILSMWQEGDIQGVSPCMTFSLFFFTEKEVLGARGRNRPHKPPFYRNHQQNSTKSRCAPQNAPASLGPHRLNAV